MKIPKRILVAPPEYLDENMVKAFKTIGYGCIPVWTNHGCALFVHIDSRTIKDCRYAVHSVNLELHVIDNAPLIRFDIKVYDRVDDPLHMDAFLNIQNEDHIPAIEALAEQQWMVFHWYDEDLKYVQSSSIRWQDENRKTAAEIIQKAKNVIVETGGGDFDRAKMEFMNKNPLI